MSVRPESLLSINQAVLVSFLTDWINDEDLCYLDSAVCSTQLRRTFLVALRKCTIVHVNLERINRLEKYEWITQRGMRLKSVCLTTFELKPGKYLLCITQHLKYLEAPAIMDLVHFIKLRSLKVEVLKLTGKTLNRVVAAILRALNGVIELDLSDCIGLTYPVNASISALSPNLRKFTCAGNLNVAPLLEQCKYLETVYNCGVFKYDEREKLHKIASLDLKRTDTDNCLISVRGYNYQAMGYYYGAGLTVGGDLAPPKIRYFDCVTHVDFSNSRLDDGDDLDTLLTFFRQAHQMRSIKMNSCMYINNDWVDCILQNCRQLECLYLDHTLIELDKLLDIMHQARSLHSFSFDGREEKHIILC